MKKSLIIAIVVIFVLGIIFAVLGICLSKGDVKALTGESFEVMTYEKSISEVPEINKAELNIDIGSVIIKKGDNLKIDYIENEKTTNDIKINDGVLTFTQTRDKLGTFGVNWGIQNTNDIVVTLPNDNIPLSINVKNGLVKIEGGDYITLDIKTNNGMVALSNSSFLDSAIKTDNGMVEIKNCTFKILNVKCDNGAMSIKDSSAQSIIGDLDNGAVTVKNVELEENGKFKTDLGKIELTNIIAKSLYGETNNGQIALNGAASDSYILRTDNGSIMGSVKGIKAEYNITVNNKHGKSNLANSIGSTDKTLDLTVANGEIKITFAE